MRTLLPACVFLGILMGCGMAGNMPNADDSDMEQEMSNEESSDTTVVASGSFSGRSGHSTTGAYKITHPEGSEDLALRLTEDFETDEGPDLHVILSPVSPSNATGSNVNGENAIVVTELTTPIGEQGYDLSDDLELESYNTVAIHCIEYEALFGAAELD